jgi:hypothetical protein
LFDPGIDFDLVVRPFLIPWFALPAVERVLDADSVLTDLSCALLANSFLRLTAIEVAVEIDFSPAGAAFLLCFLLS